MIRAHRVNATAQDDASPISGWNVAPNVAYTLVLLPGSASCGVLLYDEDGLVATGAALVGTEQPCILTPQTGQAVAMVDAELGWHLLLTTTGTESQREIRVNPAVDLPDEIHPAYADDDMALARATAAIDEAAHYRDDVTANCPLGLGAGLGDVVSVPVDGAAVVGQVESITWTATPDGTTDHAVIRRHVAIAPEPYVEPTPITPPTVADDTGATDAFTATSGNVLTNDDAGLTIVAVNGLSVNVGETVDGSNGGTFTVAADGSWTFDPDGDFAALAGSETADTSVTYYASDGAAEAMATLTVTVLASGAPIWTPSEINGAMVFDALDAASITLDGSAVTAWADMFGSGITAEQGTPAAQPSMGTGEVVFAGDYLTIASSYSAAWCKALHSTGGHILALVQPFESANPNAAICLCGTNGAGATANVGMVLYFDDRSAVPRNDSIVVNATRGTTGVNSVHSVHQDIITGGSYHLVDVIIDPDNETALSRSLCSIDGADDLSINASTTSASAANAKYNFQIGAGGNNVLPLTGRIKCLAITPSVLTPTEREKFVGWAAHRHSATVLLPSDHPYKSAPPTV